MWNISLAAALWRRLLERLSHVQLRGCQSTPSQRPWCARRCASDEQLRLQALPYPLGLLQLVKAALGLWVISCHAFLPVGQNNPAAADGYEPKSHYRTC